MEGVRETQEGGQTERQEDRGSGLDPGGRVEGVTPLGTDRDREAPLAMHTEVSSSSHCTQGQAVWSGECGAHACDSVVYRYLCAHGLYCVYICLFLFSSFPYCWSSLVPYW